MKIVVRSEAYTLDASNVAQSSYDAWDNATNYHVGDRVYHNPADAHIYHEFESLTNNTASEPLEGGTTDWLDLGTCNRCRMWDGLNNSRTVATDPSGNIVTTTSHSARVSALALLGMENVATVRVQQVSGAETVQDVTFDLLTSDNPVGWYSWLFGEVTYKRSLLVPLIGVYASQTITLTLTGAAVASVAQCIIGADYEMGTTEYGSAAPRLQSYSTFQPNDFGVYTYVPRQNTRTGRYTTWIQTSDLDRVYRLMERLESSLVLLDANNNGSDYDTLRAYGKITDFSPGVSCEHTPIDITIEGIN